MQNGESGATGVKRELKISPKKRYKEVMEEEKHNLVERKR